MAHRNVDHLKKPFQRLYICAIYILASIFSAGAIASSFDPVPINGTHSTYGAEQGTGPVSDSNSPVSAFDVDTSINAPITGLWWNADESGWGVTLTQQFDIIGVTIFTYDENGLPMWYVTSCTVVGDTCEGLLFRVSNGSDLVSLWDGSNKVTTEVGTITLTFVDNDTGTMSYTIDGTSASKDIIRQVFNTRSESEPFSGLWWNADESGWGVTLTQQDDIIGVTIFTYDSNGNPYWYVTSVSAESPLRFGGELFEVANGSSLLVDWDGSNKQVTDVGSISFEFANNDEGTMQFDIDGSSASKMISRQVFALDNDGDGVSNNNDAFPNDASESADSDSDGVGDNADQFPNDSSETIDSDADGVGNNADNCPTTANADQSDSNNNGIGDACDVSAPVYAEVQAIFNANCTGCHGGNGGLTLSSSVSYNNLINVPSVGVPSVDRVEPGDADNSYLIWKLEGRAGISGGKMPLGGSLSASDINLIRDWIDAGANP